MRLEWRDPEELADNPANWRVHPAPQMVALDATIQDVGWAGALLYNELTGRLIDGKARKDLSRGKGKVPVLIGSWTEEQERKILATLDPLGTMAEVDPGALSALLQDGAAIEASLGNLLNELAAATGGMEAPSEASDSSGTKFRFSRLDPLPAMTWVLIGIDTARFGVIAQAVEGIAAVPGVVCEMGRK